MTSNYKVLKLNKSYFPISVADWKAVAADIFSEVVFPIRILTNEDGEIVEFIPYRLGEWLALTPRVSENIVGTPHGGKFIVPNMVACANYDELPKLRVKFPTKKNIWERDKNTCAYTGKLLGKSELSIDHIIPSSRGGKDSWENLVTCDRELNSWKSDRTPEECVPPLKLRFEPTKPSNCHAVDIYDKKWAAFLR